MKTKQAKYNEAVQRNFASFRRQFEQGKGIPKEQLAKETLASLKTRIGIKVSDTIHDLSISELLGKAKAFVASSLSEKKTEKAEKTKPKN